ncbi:hypothetical protein M3I54_22485 [Paraburkholderia sp. CNPSo 3274]|uniref:hypothetical protein n=1 Tax=Paraburkholderia sp. CNPSo 3274 TaxID=2940932 RepID=UPI0020B88C92|nr:hypothetical protein [Paraburkholderia sp. CNPSo 3274]MCP3709714.1 hypothetical protein [Paraburkholderia sp. CNPSo 3274]
MNTHEIAKKLNSYADLLTQEASRLRAQARMTKNFSEDPAKLEAEAVAVRKMAAELLESLIPAASSQSPAYGTTH